MLSIATCKHEAEALAITNDTEFCVEAGLAKSPVRVGCGGHQGRTHLGKMSLLYPILSAFGGYKKLASGVKPTKCCLSNNSKKLVSLVKV